MNKNDKIGKCTYGFLHYRTIVVPGENDGEQDKDFYPLALYSKSCVVMEGFSIHRFPEPPEISTHLVSIFGVNTVSHFHQELYP